MLQDCQEVEVAQWLLHQLVLGEGRGPSIDDQSQSETLCTHLRMLYQCNGGRVLIEGWNVGGGVTSVGLGGEHLTDLGARLGKEETSPLNAMIF